MNLVLIETSGNQQYIFSTNKLRENVGASELTYRAGTQWVLDAVAAAKLGKPVSALTQDQLQQQSLFDEEAATLRRNLLDKNPAKRNPPIEGAGEPGDKAVEVIIATSGKALLLVKSPHVGEQIVSEVTVRALREAPGLSVHGVISAPFNNLESSEEINDRVKEVHAGLEEVRLQVPGVSTRFLRLPFVEPCATSGFPASKAQKYKNDVRSYPRSSVTLAKMHFRNKGYERIMKLVKHSPSDERLRFPPEIDEFKKDYEDFRFLSVIHADGNGLGQVFLKFVNHIRKVPSDEPREGRDYLNKYRRFSLALDVCTAEAFNFAVEKLKERVRREDDKREQAGKSPRKYQVPILPLIVGGDDLTVLCEGKYAVQFAHDFLTQFESETAKDQLVICDDYSDTIVRQVAHAAFHVGRFASCAGIAIIKPHFPFHNAYELAEALLRSAKDVKEKVKQRIDGRGDANEEQLPCSALDYHILFDASGVNLSRIRESLQPDDSTRLYARPYVVTNALSRATPESQKWFGPRTWRRLEERIQAMRKKDDDEDATRRKLPNSMLHELREGMFDGNEEADARMRLVRTRYKQKGFDVLLADSTGEGTLFFEEEKEHITGFIDALDLVEFWSDDDSEQTKNASRAGGTQQ